jgi:branched-chain amino acid aminotransferase
VRVHKEGASIDAPWLTRAFLLGDGVFETMRTYGRVPFLLDAHVERLLRSADMFMINHSRTQQEIAGAVEDAVSKDTSEGELAVRAVLASTGELLVLTESWKGYPEEFYSRGLRLCTSTWRRIPESSFPSQAKSTSYAQFLLIQREGVARGCDDAVILSADGSVCETSRSNIFLVSEDGISTPSLDTGVFPGITRRLVIEIAKELGEEVRERHVDQEELISSSEVILTSSLLEVAPVASIDGRPMCGGGSGKSYREIRARFVERTR